VDGWKMENLRQEKQMSVRAFVFSRFRGYGNQLPNNPIKERLNNSSSHFFLVLFLTFFGALLLIGGKKIKEKILRTQQIR
jgi:hypothetical protein